MRCAQPRRGARPARDAMKPVCEAASRRGTDASGSTSVPEDKGCTRLWCAWAGARGQRVHAALVCMGRCQRTKGARGSCGGGAHWPVVERVDEVVRGERRALEER
eukprot:2989865-Prymnesium_polylepis.1